VINGINNLFNKGPTLYIDKGYTIQVIDYIIHVLEVQWLKGSKVQEPGQFKRTSLDNKKTEFSIICT
jgi:hypothetical protein